MIKKISLLLLSLLIISCSGGSPENHSHSNHSDGSTMTYEEFKSQAYKEPNVPALGKMGVYVVNGDTPIKNEKKLKEFYNRHFSNGRLIVHQSDGVDVVWDSTQKKNLTYCINNKAKGSWFTTGGFGEDYEKVKQAIKVATAEWEKVADVKFIHVESEDSNCTSTNNNILFDINPAPSTASYLARAFFPDSGRSSRNILIAKDSLTLGSGDRYTLKGVLVHELGHVLGLRHEHTRPESGECFEDNNWRPLTPYDSNSVMHYPQCNGTNQGDLVLTQHDKEGIIALYGASGSTDDDDDDNNTVTPTVTDFTNQSVASKEEKQYGPFKVKAGTLFVASITGDGDADLYVRFNEAPTTTGYNCRPYESGSDETCSIDVSSGVEDVYVMVRGYSSSNYSLKVTYFPLEVVADTTAPTVNVTAPVSDITAGQITITADASDNIGVTKVEFYANGTKIGEQTAAPYSINYTATEGTLAIKAIAYDAAGNTATDDDTSVTVNPVPVDTTPPTVIINAPASVAAGEGITVIADANDNVGVTKVEFYNNGTKIGEDTAAPYSMDYGTASAGTMTVKVIAYDAAGNTGTAEKVIVINPDTTAPTVNVTAPVSDVTAGQITITADASDNIGVTKVEFYANGTKIGEKTAAPYSINYTATEGTLAIKAIAYDAAGNTATDDDTSVSVTIQNVCYSESTSGAVNSLYVAGKLTLSQYMSYGAAYGYLTTITIYKLEDGTWVHEDDLPEGCSVQ